MAENGSEGKISLAVAPREARIIRVAGIVQGVGFRPFVYNLAREMGLAGWVLNHSGGVDIVVEGPAEQLDRFVQELQRRRPPLAYIVSLQVQPTAVQGYADFTIRPSEQVAGQYLLISPDVATCPDCLRELFDPADRRYRYPFINCTNCGPRFTIIADIPYDRANTTMRVFPMCPDCQREYDDPTNRRFHAQPNACPVCGPHIWLTDPAGRPLAAGPDHADTEAVLAAVKELLLAGRILAIKGLGGFHLACDATNPEAVALLRQRKRRPAKPFAVMMASLEEVRRHCRLTPAEEALMTSPQCPIVLLERLESSDVVPGVAPGHRTLGVMLPYTPLHHILLRDVGRPLVMTSGNLSEEPIACDNEEALRRLGHLADAFLFHNRDIYSRYDDSVWQVVSWGGSAPATQPQPLRRARGYAPFPIALPFPVTSLLAVGPALKNTFCLTRDRYAFLSQHIGDMENLETLEHFSQTLELYRHLFRLEPRGIVHDLHPDYMTTRFAQEYAGRTGIPILGAVQHHKAHIAACLADNGWRPEDGEVIGVAMDGTGYGEDGRIWGGEWFVGGYAGMRRLAHLMYLPLPGGDAAIHHPWRIAAGYLYTLLGPEAVPADLAPAEHLSLLLQQVDRRLNTPLTSSMGRLFDAVSALLGICRHASYEAQPAIEMEHAAEPAPAPAPPYPFELEEQDGVTRVRLEALFDALLQDMRRGAPVPAAAWRFHLTVAHMIVDVCRSIAEHTGLRTVALSGGCFQNRLLLRLSVPLLEQAGFRVLLHRQVPCNDGGVALGQAVLGHFLCSEEES